MAKKRITEKMFVTSVSVPDALYQRLKLIALDQRRPVIDLVRQALEEYARRHQKPVALTSDSQARLRALLDNKRRTQ